MMEAWVAVLLLNLCLCGEAFALRDGDLRLELASVVFRHGDRSPVHGFPTDPYTEADWPQGYGQLSLVGMQQQYHLGELLKNRYVVSGGCDGLICDNYTRVQVRIRATDVDRTLMSAESQLAAFFIPGPSQMFNDTLAWQPIPIHTIPTKNDSLLRPLDNCPIFAQLQESDMHTNPEYIALGEKYKHDTTVAAMTSGLNVTNQKQPGYTTAFAVELYSNVTSGEFFVQLFRRDGPDSDTFNLLNASYCSNPTLCTLQEFQTYAEKLIPTDLAKECAAKTTPTPTPTPSSQDLQQQNRQLRIAVIGLGSAVGVVLLVTFVLIILLVSVCRKKNAKALRLYSALNAD